MAKTLYLMRLGYTLLNLLNKKQGWCDSPLVDLGVMQAREAGAYLRSRGVTFDHCYSSPSGRAVETLGVALGEDVMYKTDKGLREWCFGIFEGQDNYLSPHPLRGDYFVPYGGEGEDAVRERMLGAIGRIMARDGHECVLVVSHGAAMRLFYEHWEALSQVELVGGIANCGVFEFLVEDGSYRCVSYFAPSSSAGIKPFLPKPTFPLG